MALNDNRHDATGIDNRWWWIAAAVAIALVAYMVLQSDNNISRNFGGNATTPPVTGPATSGGPATTPSR